jgi:glycosyltransferase involved in cell wall biosynthesis
LRKHYQIISQKSDACVLLSEKYFDDFRDVSRPYNTNILAIPNPNTFQLSHLDLDNKEKIILYVGRLKESDKNPLSLLKVWTKIYKKHSDWKLLLVGDGEDIGLLQSYCKKYQLERVIFEGPKRDVASYYKRASFICLTSKFEGWGMSLVEGMSFGCIPFTFNNYGAASEIIDDGINGCLVPAFEIDMYANRMSDLISNENQRLFMAKKAFLKSRKFDLAKITLKWDMLFRYLNCRRKR